MRFTRKDVPKCHRFERKDSKYNNKFYWTMFCLKNSRHLSNVTVRTAQRHGKFLMFYQFVKCKQFYVTICSMCFYFASKHTTLWEILWCKSHSGNAICKMFINVWNLKFVMTLFSLLFFFLYKKSEFFCMRQTVLQHDTQLLLNEFSHFQRDSKDIQYMAYFSQNFSNFLQY